MQNKIYIFEHDDDKIKFCAWKLYPGVHEQKC